MWACLMGFSRAKRETSLSPSAYYSSSPNPNLRLDFLSFFMYREREERIVALQNKYTFHIIIDGPLNFVTNSAYLKHSNAM